MDHRGEFETVNLKKSTDALGTTNTSTEPQATEQLCILLGGTISRMGVEPKLRQSIAGKSEINIVEQERI